MSDAQQEKCDNCCRLENVNQKLKNKNRYLMQHQLLAIGSYFGVIIVTLVCGLSVAFLGTIDKPKAAVLIVLALCWTGLSTMGFLMMAKDRAEDD